MDIQTDEDEHSIEMTLPYIAKVMEEYVDFRYKYIFHVKVYK